MEETWGKQGIHTGTFLFALIQFLPSPHVLIALLQLQHVKGVRSVNTRLEPDHILTRIN